MRKNPRDGLANLCQGAGLPLFVARVDNRGCLIFEIDNPEACSFETLLSVLATFITETRQKRRHTQSKNNPVDSPVQLNPGFFPAVSSK